MKHLPTFLINNPTLCVVLTVIFVGFVCILVKDINTARRSKFARPIYCYDFLDQWDMYRCSDTSGCYVILIYKRRPSQRSIRQCKGYQEVYVGQSVNMYKRVHNHLTGHGNGDVYADVKYKRFVYVKFVPCSIAKLNEYEKQLIAHYNATESYNRTKGGAKVTRR